MNIISEDKSNTEDHDRAAVDTDSFEQMHGQLGSNIAVSAMSCGLSQPSKWNCIKKCCAVSYKSAKFQLDMMYLCY